MSFLFKKKQQKNGVYPQQFLNLPPAINAYHQCELGRSNSHVRGHWKTNPKGFNSNPPGRIDFFYEMVN